MLGNVPQQQLQDLSARSSSYTLTLSCGHVWGPSCRKTIYETWIKVALWHLYARNCLDLLPISPGRGLIRWPAVAFSRSIRAISSTDRHLQGWHYSWMQVADRAATSRSRPAALVLRFHDRFYAAVRSESAQTSCGSETKGGSAVSLGIKCGACS